MVTFVTKCCILNSMEIRQKKTKHTSFVTKVYLKTNYHTAILAKKTVAESVIISSLSESVKPRKTVMKNH